MAVTLQASCNLPSASHANPHLPHNYKCFSNFELTLGPLQLLLGGNGTGKSSILDAIANLQSLLVGRGGPATPTYQADLTRWDNRNRQVLEIDVQRPLDQATFRYHVEFELDYNKLSRKVIGETLTCNGKFLYRTEDEKTEALINGTDFKQRYRDTNGCRDAADVAVEIHRSNSDETLAPPSLMAARLELRRVDPS